MEIFEIGNKSPVEGWKLVEMTWAFLNTVFDDAAEVTMAYDLHQKSLVLLALLEHADTPKEIAHLLRSPASTVSHMLSELERKGLIERSLDASDRRRFRLQRTAAGQEALEAGIAAINKAVAGRLERLSEREQELLTQALPLLTRLMDG